MIIISYVQQQLNRHNFDFIKVNTILIEGYKLAIKREKLMGVRRFSSTTRYSINNPKDPNDPMEGSSKNPLKAGIGEKRLMTEADFYEPSTQLPEEKKLRLSESKSDHQSKLRDKLNEKWEDYKDSVNLANEQHNKLNNELNEIFARHADKLSPKTCQDIIDSSATYEKARETMDIQKNNAIHRLETEKMFAGSLTEQRHLAEMNVSKANEMDEKISMMLADPGLSRENRQEIEKFKGYSADNRDLGKESSNTGDEYSKAWAECYNIDKSKIERRIDKSIVEDFANPSDDFPSYSNPED